MAEQLYDVYTVGTADEQKPVSAVEVVIDYIRTQILERKLRIGDKLPTEGELCELLQIGRGSVREAVKRLEAIQLLDVRRGDGTYIANVRELTAFDTLLYKIVLEDIDFQQILDYRIQLEIGVMQLAIRNCTDDDIAALRENCQAFESCIRSGAENLSLTLHNLDLEFHQLLGKATKNLLLADVYKASLKLFSPYMLHNYQQGQAQQSPQETIENHRLLLIALERRDIYAAIHAVINSTSLWNTWISAARQTDNLQQSDDCKSNT